MRERKTYKDECFTYSHVRIRKNDVSCLAVSRPPFLRVKPLSSTARFALNNCSVAIEEKP